MILWKKWLWVVQRQINDSWRMRRLGDGLITTLNHGLMLDALNSSHLFVISRQQSSYLEALSVEEISHLVEQLSRHAAPSREGAIWQTFSSRKGL